jgi:hypothetical protein
VALILSASEWLMMIGSDSARIRLADQPQLSHGGRAQTATSLALPLPLAPAVTVAEPGPVVTGMTVTQRRGAGEKVLGLLEPARGR